MTSWARRAVGRDELGTSGHEGRWIQRPSDEGGPILVEVEGPLPREGLGMRGSCRPKVVEVLLSFAIRQDPEEPEKLTVDPSGSSDHSRNECLLNTTASISVTVLHVLAFGCVL